MADESNLRDMFIAIVAATEQPNAPFVLKDAHLALKALGEMLVRAGVDDDKCRAYAKMILSGMPETEKETIPTTPEWIVALGTALTVSIEGYILNPSGNKR